MKGGGGGGKGGGGKNEPAPPPPPPAPPAITDADTNGGGGGYQHTPRTWIWKNGDMIFLAGEYSTNIKTQVYGYYGHMGIYYAGLIIDSMPTKFRPQGVQRTNWNRFSKDYKEIYAKFVTYNSWGGALSSAQLLKVGKFAQNQLGREYGWFTPTKTANMSSGPAYCSLIPWAAYKSEIGYDLDVDGGRWVTPDDIFASPRTLTFAYSKFIPGGCLAINPQCNPFAAPGTSPCNCISYRYPYYQTYTRAH